VVKQILGLRVASDGILENADMLQASFFQSEEYIFLTSAKMENIIFMEFLSAFDLSNIVVMHICSLISSSFSLSFFSVATGKNV
jgi:hypothetical protein